MDLMDTMDTMDLMDLMDGGGPMPGLIAPHAAQPVIGRRRCPGP